MAGILCAIRGGPASQSTIEASINLAKETGETIYFLYVINLDFLTHTTSSRTDRIYEDMRSMGEFILIDAQDKAHRLGAKAETVIADGNVIKQIIAVAADKDASYVVLGTPSSENENNLFVRNKSQAVADRIRSETRAEVVFS
jgi:nucleotide-binding universal stress UspA family protein